eukprot:767337-Hanusia_phi.AAC.4
MSIQCTPATITPGMRTPEPALSHQQVSSLSFLRAAGIMLAVSIPYKSLRRKEISIMASCDQWSSFANQRKKTLMVGAVQMKLVKADLCLIAVPEGVLTFCKVCNLASQSNRLTIAQSLLEIMYAEGPEDDQLPSLGDADDSERTCRSRVLICLCNSRRSASAAGRRRRLGDRAKGPALFFFFLCK